MKKGRAWQDIKCIFYLNLKKDKIEKKNQKFYDFFQALKIHMMFRERGLVFLNITKHNQGEKEVRKSLEIAHEIKGAPS